MSHEEGRERDALISAEGHHYIHHDRKSARDKDRDKGIEVQDIEDVGWAATLRSVTLLTLLKVLAVALFVGVVIALLVLVFIPNSPIENALFDFMTWVDEIPLIWGSLLMGAVQCIAVVLMLPGTPFNLACGFMFQIWIGSAVSIISTDLAAVISFLAVRYLFRDWAESQINKRPKFKAIDLAVQKHGMWLIALIRLSPVLPFGLCNYFFGLTKVGFWKYWLASTIGLTPYTVAYTYLGSLLRDITEVFNGETTWSVEYIVLVSVGGVATVLTIIVVTLITRRALNSIVDESAIVAEEKAAEDVESGEREREVDGAHYGATDSTRPAWQS